MRTWMLRRHKESELVFEGQHLVTVDDREWLGVTPNWWELTLYRTTHRTFVLGSTYYQNYPRGATVYGAMEMPLLDDVARCLLHRCGAPEMIITALMARARRRVRFLDNLGPCGTVDALPDRILPAFGVVTPKDCPVHA